MMGGDGAGLAGPGVGDVPRVGSSPRIFILVSLIVVFERRWSGTVES
jgi:hypothetical protein